jgi:hypothetical protein
MSARELDFFVAGRQLSALKFSLMFDIFNPELKERANQIKNQISILCDNISSGEITDLVLIKRFQEDFSVQVMQLRRENITS